ncbi:MAG: YbjQ family protein [Pirellulaceae bacterium]|jgi:uncharacterized protein YbjQ (UPF0145 family)|nr:YbjQ family protein [Pirellulaceae bacterium]
MLELILSAIFTLVLLALGYFAGGYHERQHIASLEAREAALRHMVVTQLRSYPGWVPGDAPPRLIVAEAVIGSDFLKTFLASLRYLIGGEVRSFRSLLDRARREATLRVLEEAHAAGYNAICNLRLDSADIGGNAATSGQKGTVMAAILASATAYQAARPTY